MGQHALSALLCALALAAAGATSQDQAPSLEPGPGLERVLGRGESHTYAIRCPTGSYVHAVVDQRGVDVVATVLGPDGSEWLRVDTPTEPTSRDGSETVPFLAERAGIYRLVVRAANADGTGAYGVRVETCRPPTSPDHARVEAVRLWAEASLESDQNAAARARALESYERSGQLLQDAGSTYDASRVLKLAADLAASLDDWKRAAADYDRVRELSLAAGAQRMEGKAHLGLGVGHRQLGAPEQARDHFQRALEIFQALHDDRGTGAALANLAAVNWDELGDAPEALRLFAQALDLSHALHDSSLERAILHNMATIYDWSGEKTRALDFYERSLALEPIAPDARVTGITHNEIGVLYTQWGDYARARDAHVEALKLYRGLGNRVQEVWTLLHIGRTYALDRQVDRSLIDLQAALTLSREIKDTTLEAHALSRLGEAFAAGGNTPAALEHLRAAVALYRGLSKSYWSALALVQLGRASLAAGKLEEAQAALVEARDLAGRYAAGGIEAAALREMARVALARNDPETARDDAAAAVHAVEAERAKIVQGDFKATYFASIHAYYQTYIQALIAMDAKQPDAGFVELALHVSERARARRVLEGVIESSIDLRATADPPLVEQERKMRRAISYLAMQQVRLGEQDEDARRAATDRKLREQEAQHEQILTRLRQSSPDYTAVIQPSILEGKEVQQALDPETALLEYAVGDEISYVWVVSQTSLKVFRLPGAATLDALARRLYHALSARAEESPSLAETQRRAAIEDRRAAAAAEQLSDLILPDALSALAVKRLVIVADGSLQVVPFSALPLSHPAGAANRSRPLLGSRFEVVYAPSASWVAALRRLRDGRAAPPKAVALLADPVFDPLDSRVGGSTETDSSVHRTPAALQRAASDVGLRSAGTSSALPRLPFTRREALQIATIVPHGDGSLVALDFDASRERAMSPELTQYRIVHFATHSLLDNDHPDLSGIVLSLVDRKGKGTDGFLRIQDIYNLQLRAELVVLSACRTAIGKSIPGEGLMGMARAFLYAGTRQVVASLWPVDEKATMELMVEFYRQVLKNGVPPAQALRRAQQTLASTPRWHAPYYWAGFVLEGDWRR